MALTPGTRLGPYSVSALIGIGGMGEVYQATDTHLKRQVAIKVLPAVAERVANNPVGGTLLTASTQAGASGLAAFSASERGVLAYRTGGAESAVQLVWVDRAGKPLATVGPASAYRGADVSPDGTRVAVHRHEGNGGDIWLIDERGVASRFTFDASQENVTPAWSRDGRRIAYASQRGKEFVVVQKGVDSASDEEVLLKGESTGENRGRLMPTSWSPDGKYLLYTAPGGAAWDFRIWVLPLQGERKPFRLISGSSFVESAGQVSPDGRWVAYESYESGRQEVYVRPFLNGSGKRQVSTGGGASPHWTADGKDILFLSSGQALFIRGQAAGTVPFFTSASEDAKVASVSINATASTLHPGAPAELFVAGQARLGHDSPYAQFSVSADGKRFLIPRPRTPPETSAPSPSS